VDRIHGEPDIKDNAHVLRVLAEPTVLDSPKYKFWVFRGGKDSIRFTYALEAEWGWMSTIFTDADGEAWRSLEGLSVQQRIASYTRTIRCHLDPEKPKQASAYDRFWEVVCHHTDRGRYAET